MEIKKVDCLFEDMAVKNTFSHEIIVCAVGARAIIRRDGVGPGTHTTAGNLLGKSLWFYCIVCRIWFIGAQLFKARLS